MEDRHLSIALAQPRRDPPGERLRGERILGKQELAVLDDERYARHRGLPYMNSESGEPIVEVSGQPPLQNGQGKLEQVLRPRRKAGQRVPGVRERLSRPRGREERGRPWQIMNVGFRLA
jgi:hypothetical protein